MVCAGKKIHEKLLDPGNEGVDNIAGRYVQECQLMSHLRHPNIIQFMGVCYLPNSELPVLLMEKLNSSLDDRLETVPNIPLVLKHSMLEDVARGLLYLHKNTPQIIHRDLTAKNVLLTSSLVAKITDFGNSRIVNLQPGQLARTLSQYPGTLAYMPPEALSANARYGPSLDVFSFGHLALFTLNQVYELHAAIIIIIVFINRYRSTALIFMWICSHNTDYSCNCTLTLYNWYFCYSVGQIIRVLGSIMSRPSRYGC